MNEFHITELRRCYHQINFSEMSPKEINYPPKLNPLKSRGLQINLGQSKQEQELINALSFYSSNWIRVKLVNNNLQTNDQFQGKK